MALELAEIAAGLPVAASFALAGGITTLREGRRRSLLNEAVHELRRPLQALSLALPADCGAADSSLLLATAALERLDREINGTTLEVRKGTCAVDLLLGATLERWKARAVMDERPVRLRGASAQTYVQGNWTELSQALDNLINNAFEHGGGEISIEVRKDPHWVYLSVLDGGRVGSRPTMSRARRGAGGGRRGHGLRVVARVVREHGGDFSFWASSEGSEARLRLPRAEAGER